MVSVFRKTAMERLSSPDQLDGMLKITSPMSWMAVAAAAFLAVVVIIWSLTGSLSTTVSVYGVIAYSYGTNTLYSDAAGQISSILVQVGDAVEEGTAILEILNSDGTTLTVTSKQSGRISSVLVEEGEEVIPNSELFRVSPQTENALSVVCYVDSDTIQSLENGMTVLVYLSNVDSTTYGHMNAVITNMDACVVSEEAMQQIAGENSSLSSLLSEDTSYYAITCELQQDTSAASGYEFSNSNSASVSVEAGTLVTAEIVLEESTPISKVFPALGGN